MRYLGRYSPSAHRQLRNACRSFGDEIGRLFPNLHAEAESLYRGLRNELGRVFPVFSAETTKGSEAEFIRDQLPGRFSFWVPLLAIVAIAALVWLPGSQKDETPPSTRLPSASAGLPPAVEPGTGEHDPLSVAELRWCLTEEVRLEAIRPRLETRPAADRYNQFAEDFNSLCGGRKSSNEERDEVTTDIAASRQSIVAAANEDAQRLNDAVPIPTTRAQELLSMLGYDPGAVEGVYEPQTKAAIEAFQRRQGIPVDGLLSRELLDQLAGALARDRIRSERCRILSVRDTSEQQHADFRC
jgi:hypothetical protein